MHIDEETFTGLQNLVRNTAYLIEVAANRIWDTTQADRDRHADALMEIAVNQMSDILRVLEAVEFGKIQQAAEPQKIAA